MLSVNRKVALLEKYAAHQEFIKTAYIHALLRKEAGLVDVPAQVWRFFKGLRGGSKATKLRNPNPNMPLGADVRTGQVRVRTDGGPVPGPFRKADGPKYKINTGPLKATPKQIARRQARVNASQGVHYG